MTQEEAAVAAAEQEQRALYLAVSAGLLAAGGVAYRLLKSLERAGKNMTLRQRTLDNDFPAP